METPDDPYRVAPPGTLPEDEWDDYEEDGPQDLEDQLDSALDRAFPHREEAK